MKYLQITLEVSLEVPENAEIVVDDPTKGELPHIRIGKDLLAPACEWVERGDDGAWSTSDTVLRSVEVTSIEPITRSELIARFGSEQALEDALGYLVD